MYYGKNNSVNCFRAAIYQILQEGFANQLSVEDIAKIQLAILPKNQEKKSTLDPDVTLPKEIFDLITAEDAKKSDMDMTKEQYLATIQDPEIIEKIKLMSLESFMNAFNSSKNKEPFEQLYAITLQAYHDANAQHEFEQKAFGSGDYESVFKSALKSQDSGDTEIQMSLAQQYSQKENHGAGALEDGRHDLSEGAVQHESKLQSDRQITLEEMRAQRIKYLVKHDTQQSGQEQNHGAGVWEEGQHDLPGDNTDTDAHSHSHH